MPAATAWAAGVFQGSAPGSFYGYDERSRKRVKRDPADPPKLQLVSGFLPVLAADDPMGQR
jgi:hypothetical protein